MGEFPRWAVWRRAYVVAEGTVARLPVRVLVAVVGAIMGWVLGGLLGGIIGLLLVIVGFLGWELVRYPLSGFRDSTWEAACEQATDSEVAGLELRARVVIPPFDPRLAYQECHVRRPDGTVVVIPNDQIRGTWVEHRLRLVAWYVVGDAGRHVVRWYGSKAHDGRRLFEVARAEFDLHEKPPWSGSSFRTTSSPGGVGTDLGGRLRWATVAEIDPSAAIPSVARHNGGGRRNRTYLRLVLAFPPILSRVQCTTLEAPSELCSGCPGREVIGFPTRGLLTPGWSAGLDPARWSFLVAPSRGLALRLWVLKSVGEGEGRPCQVEPLLGCFRIPRLSVGSRRYTLWGLSDA